MINWNWKQLGELMRMKHSSMPLGDLAALKFDTISTVPSGINERLRAQGNSCLEVDMNTLRALPDGTVGREFARLLDKRGLQPFKISASMKERLANNPYALRYTTTHDLFHVLTGFPTTPSGELGLFAFMIAQGFGGGDRSILWLSLALYAALVPLHFRGALHNVKLGLAMGEKARPLLEEPLEQYLAEPLPEVRRRLNLPDPLSAGIDPGHESVLFNWLVPKEPVTA